MSVKQEVSSFITQLQERGESLFPYLHNKNYEKGQSNIYYSGPYWDENEVTAAITTLLSGK